MTEFEKKAEEIRQSAEQAKAEAQNAKAEAAAAKAEAEAAKSELAKREAELKTAQTNIDNLDASVKEQAAAIKELKKALEDSKSVSFKADFRRALEAKKPEIEKALKSKADRFECTLELKDIVSIGTGSVSPNNRLSVMDDPTIYAAVPVANAFILAFGIRPRTANKLGWIESTNQPTVDYVAELAQNTNKSDVSFVEKSRAFGKLATYMQISTEFEDWFEQLYNYCVNEGARMIENKLDNEICAGAGADTNATTQKKIYGLKSQATAFSALASHAVANANAADVIFDAMDQIAKEGFHANVAFVTWTIYRTIKSLKDSNGNYLFDQVSGMLSGVRLLPTTRLSSGEILVADTNCAEIYAGNSYELEFIRNGAYDAYDVYFRKAAQTKVPAANKKGLIYVSNVATAITALAPTE
jgi:HK97 family phage major capsid protein